MKFASCILLCQVLLSVFYGCSVVLFNYSPSNAIAACFKNVTSEASTGRVIYQPLGDPIDSPKPNDK